MREPLIIVGSSARAAAQSADRAGFAPWCIDRRGDRDLKATPNTTVHVCRPNDWPRGVLKLIDQAPAGAKVLLTGGLDGEFDLLNAIGFERKFLTSPPEAVRKVRWPTALATIPTTPGLRHCKTLTSISFLRRLWRLAFGSFGRTKYLIKPRDSYGGQDIHWYRPGQAIDAKHYLQQYVRGQSLSAVFHCDGWSAVLLGATEQLVGETAFGAGPFAYCGSIGLVSLGQKAKQALTHLGVVLTQRFDLRGVFGVDLVMDFHGDLWPIEVNPRYTASVELIEKLTGAHALSPTDGSRKHAEKRPGATGKAVVFAKQPGKVPDLYEILEHDQVADVPEEGRTLRRGAAICTVFAVGNSRDDCYAKLKSLAQKVYDAM